MQTIFDLDSKVKINFETLSQSYSNKIQLNEDELKEIKEFDEKYNGVHTVTEIVCKKDKNTGEKIIQISLEDDFFFYDKELILVEG